MNSADKASTHNETTQANQKYQEAYNRLIKLEHDRPDWEPTIVKYRLEYLREKLGLIPQDACSDQKTDEGIPYSDELLAKASRGESKAQLDIARCYRKGNGIQKDNQKAFEWAAKASEKQNEDAMFFVAVCCLQGDGVTQDEQRAVKIFKELADQEYGKAQFGLAICLLQGRGIVKNEKEAVKLFLKTAKRGDSNSQYYLGKCFLEGIGIDENKAEAISWLEKSKDQGNGSARRLLAKISDK